MHVHILNIVIRWSLWSLRIFHIAMKIHLTITFVILAVLITDSNGFWFRRSHCGTWFRHRPCTAGKCSDPSRGRPYYFGTTSLWCMVKGKREASPSRPTWTLKHRWIQYGGHYFERLKSQGDVYRYGSPSDSSHCSTKRESKPAGYSNLSIDCLKRCTDNYKKKYGSYHWLNNNCHDFANRFSDMLCSRTTCPSWC